LGEDHHQDFVDAVLKGPTEMTARPEDGLQSVRICQKIYESVAAGKPVAVTPI
jgi:predicted dehydrogenase